MRRLLPSLVALGALLLTTACSRTAVSPLPAPAPAPAPEAGGAPAEKPAPPPLPPAPPATVNTARAVLRTQPTPGGPTALTFWDANRGWLARGTVLLGSSDGGKSWTPLATFQQAIRQLDFISSARGWALTEAGLFSSEDGGRTWQPAAQPGANPPDRVDFWDEQHGWAQTGEAYAATSDGGKTWTPFASPCSQAFIRSSFSLAGPQTGYVLCNGQPATAMAEKALFRSDDGGQHWQQVAATPTTGGAQSGGAQAGGAQAGSAQSGGLPMVGHIQELRFLDPDHGWLSLSRGGLLRSSDGGRTWQQLSGPDGQDNPPRSLRFLTAQQGFALMPGNGGILPVATRDGGKTWAVLSTAVVPAFHARLAAFDGNRAISIGSNTSAGAVLRTADGGRTWEQVGGLPGPVADVSFVDPLHGWAIVDRSDQSGPVRTLYATRDGGATWSPLPRPYADLKDTYAVVSFIDEQTGYIGSGWGHLFLTRDGGATVQPVDQADSKTSVYRFTSLTDGWKVDNLQLATTGDGGKSWTAIGLPFRVWQVEPLAGGRAWVLAGDCNGGGPCQPVLLSTADGGKQWTRWDLGAVKPSQARFTDASHGWLVDESGGLYRSDDGGRSWAQVR